VGRAQELPTSKLLITTNSSSVGEAQEETIYAKVKMDEEEKLSSIAFCP
jgi:hypothetical protein